MPKYLIERKIPNAGQMTPPQLHEIAGKSNDVLHDMQRGGTPVQWVQSYVTDDTIHCVYVAPNAEAVREHARGGGFPADAVMEVRSVIDPTTGEWHQPLAASIASPLCLARWHRWNMTLLDT